VVRQDGPPHYVSITFDYSVTFADLKCLVGIKSGMNATIDNYRSTFPKLSPKIEAPVAICRVNPDPNHVAGLDRRQVELFESLVGNDGVTVFGWSCRRQYK
jgi:hypothetical protein